MVARSPASQFADSVLPSLLFEQPVATLDRLAGDEDTAPAFISATWALAVEEAGAPAAAPPTRLRVFTFEGWRVVLLGSPAPPRVGEPYAIAVAERAGTGRLFGLERGTGHDGQPTAYPCEQRPTGVKTRYGDLALTAAPGDGPLPADHEALRLFVDRVTGLLGPAPRPPAYEEPTPEPQLLVNATRPARRRSMSDFEATPTDPIGGPPTASPPPPDASPTPTPVAPPPRRFAALRARLTPRNVAIAVVGLAGLLAAIHQIVLWTWYIEDAAISFAFARHLAAGQGLVAYPGGERVEGYSNPTWVALMALFELVGIDGFKSSKGLAVLLGFATVGLTFRIARHARPDPHDATPHLAALLLAGSAQFAIWNASGLENPLFSFLLALGIERTLAEAGDALVPGESARRRFPWSAVAFLLLALSRPEGIVYAAAGGFYGLVFALRDGRGLGPVFAWLATFFVPWTAYQAWHAAYFAYAFPNTYYAKMGDKAFKPFAWDARGWKQIREWSWALGHGALLPAYIVGVGGVRARTGVIVAGIGLLLGWPIVDKALGGSLPLDEAMLGARVGALGAFALLAPLLAADRPGARARMLCWSLAAAALAFALWANGDWMKGYRWMSLLVVPASVLLAVGIADLADAVQARLGRVARERWTLPGFATALALLVAYAVPNLAHTAWFDRHRETGPFSVKKRVEHVQNAAKRLHIDRPRVLDVDQGAHLFWSGFEMMDIAGLVDVPMAQHDFEKPFVREYVFQEKKPDFAHVHGGWASASKIPQHPEWAAEYVEMPGYGGKTLHNGNFVRKDRIVDRGPWAGTPGRSVRFAGPEGAVLEGFEMPARDLGFNQRMYVEIGLGLGNRAEDTTQVGLIVFLSDASGVAQSFWVPPGYDWYEPKDWADDERFHGRFSFDLPDTLPPGTYDLGFVLLGADHAVRGVDTDRLIARDDGTSFVEPSVPPGAVVGVAPDAPPDPSGRATAPAQLAVGEVRFPGFVTLLSADEADARSDGDVDRAVAAAEAGDCDAALAAWDIARGRQSRRVAWLDAARVELDGPIARCLAKRATGLDGEARVAALEAARVRAPADPTVRAVAVAVADTLYREGLAAKEARDWDTAYARLRDTLRLDPTRAWARRYAEEARDQHLGIRAGKVPSRPDAATAPIEVAPAPEPEGAAPEGPAEP